MSLKLNQLSEGDWVVYRPRGGPAEDGRVTSVGERYAHVLYKGDLTAKATDPADLEWGCPSAHEE